MARHSTWSILLNNPNCESTVELFVVFSRGVFHSPNAQPKENHDKTNCLTQSGCSSPPSMGQSPHLNEKRRRQEIQAAGLTPDRLLVEPSHNLTCRRLSTPMNLDIRSRPRVKSCVTLSSRLPSRRLWLPIPNSHIKKERKKEKIFASMILKIQ